MQNWQIRSAKTRHCQDRKQHVLSDNDAGHNDPRPSILAARKYKQACAKLSSGLGLNPMAMIRQLTSIDLTRNESSIVQNLWGMKAKASVVGVLVDGQR